MGSILDLLDVQISLGRGFSLEAVCVLSEVGPAMSTPSQQGSSSCVAKRAVGGSPSSHILAPTTPLGVTLACLLP